MLKAGVLFGLTKPVMLHNILHQQKHWRQGGQLACSFCTSAFKRQNASSKDPLNHLEGNPFMEKYKEKLRQKQQESPAAFAARLADIEAEKRRQETEKSMQKEQEARARKDKTSQVKSKKLDDVMKVELLQDKTGQEIEAIWAAYHREKDVIFATVPASEYKDLHQKGQEYPMFLYPIPRDEGYEFYLQQFSDHQIYFTPLLEYQVHNENAPVCLTITHYTELMEEKGIVLMVGEPDSQHLGVYQAQLLAMQVKMFYGMDNDVRFNLVKKMKNEPDTFKYMDVVKEFENCMTLSNFKDTKESKS